MGVVNAAVLEALYTSVRADFMEAYQAAPLLWERVAMRIQSSNLKETYNWDDVLPNLVEWVGDREIHDLRAEGYDLLNRDWAVGIKIMRKDIEDDRLGIHQARIQTLGMRAAQHRDQIVFGLLRDGVTNLCYDGKPFFAADHPNGNSTFSNINDSSGTPWYLLDTRYPVKPLILQVRKEPEITSLTRSEDPNVFMRAEFLIGVDDRKVAGYSFPWMAYRSEATFNAENLKAAILAMNAFVDSKGQPLGVSPNVLVIPPSLKFTAKKLLTSEMIADGLGGFENNELVGEITWDNVIVTPLVS
jgi:phage major head subunit gpT-like protein